MCVCHYRNGLGGLEMDGEKALECCMKALTVARSAGDEYYVYKSKYILTPCP